MAARIAEENLAEVVSVTCFGEVCVSRGKKRGLNRIVAPNLKKGWEYKNMYIPHTKARIV